MAAAYSNLNFKSVVESLPMDDFRRHVLRKSEDSKEFSKLIGLGAEYLSADDREVVIGILTEAFPELAGRNDFANEELDSLARAISSRSVSLR